MEGQHRASSKHLERGRSVKIVRGWGVVANRGHSPVGGENVPELNRGRSWLQNAAKCAKSHRVECFKMDTLCAENLTSVSAESQRWGGGASQNGSLLSLLTPDPDLPGQFRPATGLLTCGSHPGAMSHAHPCSLTLAGETGASRETRTFQVQGGKKKKKKKTISDSPRWLQTNRLGK